MLILVIILSGTVFAQRAKHHAQMPLSCSNCHSCNKPTFEDPCLKICPDFKREGVTLKHKAEDAPEFIKIDTLEDRYHASIFSHRLHAEMALMSGGCASCHHHNPPGEILACVDCHEPTILREDLSKPGLKGAYHKQCLNCHRSWSHETNCIVCHARKADTTTPATIADKAALKEKEHPRIKEPDKLVLETGFDSGPIVTFYHDDHTQRFGYQCVDCHKDETCSRCHDTIKDRKTTDKEPHTNCIECHQASIENNCVKCHKKQEDGRFKHADAGWPLNRYHQSLHCQACHGVEGKFETLPTACTSCHDDWSVDSFNHNVTGVVLDDIHKQFDCALCHTDRNFSNKPSCSDCHEDFVFPEKTPGQVRK